MLATYESIRPKSLEGKVPTKKPLSIDSGKSQLQGDS